MRLNLRHLSLRVLSLGDQVLFSAANFVLTLALAKYYSDYEVAGYGIGLSIALVIQSALRTAYVIQYSVLPGSLFRRRAPKILGQHLIIWAFIIGAELLICAVLLSLFFSQYLLAITVSTVICSLIYAQLEFDRIILLKHEKIVDPFLASAGFLLMNGLLFFLIPRLHIGFLPVMGMVALYVLLKITRMVFLVGRPDFMWGWRLAKRAMQRNLGNSLLGVIGFAGHSHGPLFILGLAAAPLQSAAFVATRGLMQPMQVILRSLDVIDKNVHQSGAGSPVLLRNNLLRQLILYSALSAAAIIGTMALGKFGLHLAYGDRYAGYESVLTGWSWIMLAYAVTLPLETVIVKNGRLGEYNVWRLCAGITGGVMALLLCGPYGAAGAVAASLGGWAVSIACAVWLARDILFKVSIDGNKK